MSRPSYCQKERRQVGDFQIEKVGESVSERGFRELLQGNSFTRASRMPLKANLFGV